MIKANAYGHGVERAARALSSADGFAVLDFHEAERLRSAGVAKPILLLEGFFKPVDLELVQRLALTPVIHNPEQVEILKRTTLAAQTDVYLKVNSGMNRLGFGAESLRPAYEALRMHRQVRSIILMTHFADADGAGGVKAQLDWFNELAQPLRGAGPLARELGCADSVPGSARRLGAARASCCMAVRRSRIAPRRASASSPP